MSDQPRRQFIVRVQEKYMVPKEWNILRVLATEWEQEGNGANGSRVYICLAEEDTDE